MQWPTGLDLPISNADLLCNYTSAGVMSLIGGRGPFVEPRSEQLPCLTGGYTAIEECNAKLHIPFGSPF
jgi:hypothetical protein